MPQWHERTDWMFSTVSGLISSVHHQSVSTLQVAPCPSQSSEEKMAEQNGKLIEFVVVNRFLRGDVTKGYPKHLYPGITLRSKIS